jgi:glycosyltransferase involved in cell wall biosynthesis
MGVQRADSRQMGNGMRQVRNQRPEITVLMSCFNAKRWLSESIESILCQTYEDFEFLILDDGSTDATWNIIQFYCRKDARIVAISKHHSGLAHSLNLGIAQARGVWIARLDSDDLCDPSRLAEQIKFVSSNPGVVLLGTGCVEIDEDGRRVKDHTYPSDHKGLIYHLEHEKAFFPHSSSFFRRDLVLRLGGYNARISRAEDADLWFRLFENGEVSCLEPPLLAIRKHPGQISHEQAGSRQTYDSIAARVCHFLRLAGAQDPSSSDDETNWSRFLEWLEKRLDEEGFCARRYAWLEARSSFFAAKNRLAGFLSFGWLLLQSGHAAEQVRQKFFGTTIGRQLAVEWMNLHRESIIESVSKT